MGVFDRIFKRKIQFADPQQTFKQFTAYTPMFSNWAGGIYESELVRAAINAKATHISKLSVKFEGAAKRTTVNRLKHAPNDWQTWSQFLYQLSTILDVQNTAFILPLLDEYDDTVGIMCAVPSRCEVKKYDNELYLQYRFKDGTIGTIELYRVGIMTKFQYDDELFGSNNAALMPTMKLINMQNQGITEGVKSAATYRFMAKLTNFSKPEDLAKQRKEFNANNFAAEDGGGLLLFPNTYSDIKQIDAKPFVVDAEQMKLIQDNVFNYVGVNMDILQNSADSSKLDAFFNGPVEAFAIQFSEVLTAMLYTRREREQGNKAYASANRLQYMSVSEKVQLAKELGDRGAIMIDEIRELFNYNPLPNGAGQMAPIRGEYYNANETNEGGNEDAR